MNGQFTKKTQNYNQSDWNQWPVTPVKYDMVTQQQQQQLNKQLLDVVTVGQYLYLSLQR